MTKVMSKIFTANAAIQLEVLAEGLTAYDQFRELSETFEKGGQEALISAIKNKNLTGVKFQTLEAR